jgi:SAM-dependent methyltransferase
MRQEDIWDEETAAAYDTDEGKFAPEVLRATVERLAVLAEGGPALEFAIGTGRVAVPLAARGVPVSGIELSRTMLARLRTKADEATIPVVVGDMATARVPGRFALVYLVFNTIGNLLTQEEQVECFRNAARHLAPGGRFVIELEVPQLSRLSPDTDAVVWRNDSDHDGGPGYLGVDTYDPVGQRLTSFHFRFGEGRQAHVGRMPQRYVWPAELDLMARLAGFARESRHADWAGARFTGRSRSHVSVYRLPTE